LTKAIDSQRKFGIDRNGNPNYGEEADVFFIRKSNIDKILAINLEKLFWVGNKVECSFFLWTLGLAFGGFISFPAKSSNFYILLGISLILDDFGWGGKIKQLLYLA
jgi:hypothetical protein